VLEPTRSENWVREVREDDESRWVGVSVQYAWDDYYGEYALFSPSLVEQVLTDLGFSLENSGNKEN